MEYTETFLIFATSKGNLWLSGQNPAREQDFIDTTPLFFCQRCFLTIRAESREGKPYTSLPNFTNANHAIGYAAECGEQDFIDTTPFFIAKGAF